MCGERRICEQNNVHLNRCIDGLTCKCERVQNPYMFTCSSFSGGVNPRFTKSDGSASKSDKDDEKEGMRKKKKGTSET